MYYDRYRLSAGEWFRYAAAGAGIAAAVSYVFYRSLPVFIMLSPFGLCYPLIKKADLKDQRLKRLNLEFKEGILILSSFLSAGYSVENAFSASIRELAVMYGASGMMVLEFSHMEGQIRMNRPVEQVLMEFGDRSGLDDVRNFAEVFAAAKRSGGELVSIINHTSGVIRDKIQIQEEIATMTAAVISPIGELYYKGDKVTVSNFKTGELTQKLYDTLTGIQWGTIADPYGWTVVVD